MQEHERHIRITPDETRELGIVREASDGPHSLASIHIELPDGPREALTKDDIEATIESLLDLHGRAMPNSRLADYLWNTLDRLCLLVDRWPDVPEDGEESAA